VIKDDLSSWLGRKQIDLFVTSTSQEHASIAGDHTTYPFTTKETVLTGLPRFDKLLEAKRDTPPEQQDLVLMVPTWRRWLLPPLQEGTQRRDGVDPGFFESDFLRQWLGLLRSPELARVCEEQGLTIGFLPHPNLQPVLPSIDLPDHVRAFSFDSNVRKLFARSAVLVTDYSSVAFNAAYLERPVVYYQFDADRVLGGDHVGRGGYFSYPRDGFGPVTGNLEDAIREIVGTIRAGRSPSPAYLQRIDDAFPERDGKCCARVTKAIMASTKPLSRNRAAVPVPTPVTVPTSPPTLNRGHRG
jgi:CDP-glycerol glycerophosphotransferase (TagB/SpsB family)